MTSSSNKTEQEMRQKVWEMIKDIRTSTMVTKSASGSLGARPMHAQQAEKYDGVLWFFTSDRTAKVQDIEANEDVLLVYAEPEDQNYVNINGTAEIVRDRNMIKELWSAPLKTWFPDGPEDPSIALIRFTPESAEYWDAPNSAFLHAYGMVKAAITGTQPKAGDNDTVRM